MADRSVRFVVGTPDLHSLSWKCRVTRGRDGGEIYLAPREISNDYHVSLHKSGRWHVRVGAPEARALGYSPEELVGPTWSRPDDGPPGTTLALRVFVPPAAVSRTHRVRKESSCVFIPPPSSIGSAIEVAVVLTDRAPTAIEWVGRRAMNTKLVGSCQVADQEWLTLVWREVVTPTLQDVSLSIAATKRLGADPGIDGSLGMMLWGTDAKGSPFVLIGRLDNSGAERFRRAYSQAHEGAEPET